MTVIYDEFPVVVRKVFKEMWDNVVAPLPGFQIWDDSPLVRNMFLAREGKRTRVPTHISYQEWDLTDLFRATLFAQSFGELHKKCVVPGSTWPEGFHPSVLSPIGNQMETIALALDQLRLLRNFFTHQNSTQKIDNVSFDRHIQRAKDAFAALGQSTTRIDDIANLGAEYEFPTDRFHRYQGYGPDLELAVRAANVQVGDVGVTEVETSVRDAATCVETTVTDVMKEVEEVRSHVTEVKTEVCGIKQDVQAEVFEGMHVLS